jgi:DNA-binding XRE family transcriptional regulator
MSLILVSSSEKATLLSRFSFTFVEFCLPAVAVALMFHAAMTRERESSELAKFAKDRGWDMQTLARETGISRQMIWRHGKGDVSPLIEDRRAYARVLKVPVEMIDEILNRARAKSRAANRPDPRKVRLYERRKPVVVVEQ